RSNFNVRHRFTLSGLYELPFGAGRRWLQSGAGAAGAGNWDVSGVVMGDSAALAAGLAAVVQPRRVLDARLRDVRECAAESPRRPRLQERESLVRAPVRDREWRGPGAARDLHTRRR